MTLSFIRNIVLTTLFVLNCSFQKTKEENTIYWSPDRKLTWDDFKGKAKLSNNSAISILGIEYEFNGKTLQVEVKSFFDKKTSWVKQDRQTENLLKHEQDHFDITEIYARQLRKSISKHKFRKKSIKEDFSNLYNKNKRELNCYQDLYDKETDLSRNETKQAEWNEKIAKELQALEMYADTHLSIKVK